MRYRYRLRRAQTAGRVRRLPPPRVSSTNPARAVGRREVRGLLRRSWLHPQALQR
jgi:hypothetical protein